MTTKTEIKTSLILVGKGVKGISYSEATNRYTYQVTPEALKKIMSKFAYRIEVIN